VTDFQSDATFAMPPKNFDANTVALTEKGLSEATIATGGRLD
jgi:hypothetical protein